MVEDPFYGIQKKSIIHAIKNRRRSKGERREGKGMTLPPPAPPKGESSAAGIGVAFSAGL